MGWNQIQARVASRLLAHLNTGSYVYFAHSYYVPENQYTSAACTYGVRFTAMLKSGSVQGVQFHPEKSSAVGLQIVKGFLEC